MLSSEYETLSEELQKLLDQSVQSITRIYERVFVQGMENGELAPETNTFDAASAFSGLLMGGQIIARCSGGFEALHRVAETYILAVFRK